MTLATPSLTRRGLYPMALSGKRAKKASKSNAEHRIKAALPEFPSPAVDEVIDPSLVRSLGFIDIYTYISGPWLSTSGSLKPATGRASLKSVRSSFKCFCVWQ